jgi:hypothetical protein
MNCKGDIEMHTRHACASEGNIWFDLIEKQKIGTITEAEKSILKNGHFKIK